MRHLRRALALHFVLPRLGSRVLLRHNDPLRQLHRELPRQGPVRVEGDPEALLLLKVNDFQFVLADHHLVGNRTPVRPKAFVRQPHLGKRVLAGRVQACRCVPEADLREGIRSVPVALANEVAGPVKGPSADNGLAQPAEQEFRKLNPASRFMRANRPRRAAVL